MLYRNGGWKVFECSLLFTRFLWTNYITHNANQCDVTAVGGCAVTTALHVNVNRTKVGKDGFFFFSRNQVCFECLYSMCVFRCVCMRACVCVEMTQARCQSHTLTTVLTHSNTEIEQQPITQQWCHTHGFTNTVFITLQSFRAGGKTTGSAFYFSSSQSHLEENLCLWV